MNRKESKYWKRKYPQGIQGDSLKTRQVKLPKSRKKSLAISNPNTEGVMVCMENNEAVKYWKT